MPRVVQRSPRTSGWSARSVSSRWAVRPNTSRSSVASRPRATSGPADLQMSWRNAATASLARPACARSVPVARALSSPTVASERAGHQRDHDGGHRTSPPVCSGGEFAEPVPSGSADAPARLRPRGSARRRRPAREPSRSARPRSFSRHFITIQSSSPGATSELPRFGLTRGGDRGERVETTQPRARARRLDLADDPLHLLVRRAHQLLAGRTASSPSAARKAARRGL
jgi:hypothetical protein